MLTDSFNALPYTVFTTVSKHVLWHPQNGIFNITVLITTPFVYFVVVADIFSPP